MRFVRKVPDAEAPIGASGGRETPYVYVEYVSSGAVDGLPNNRKSAPTKGGKHMNPLMPNLANAPGAKLIVSSLFDCKDPGFLAEDMLLVELPGMIYIDVSWGPEHDPSGTYTVTVFRGQDQIAELETKDAYEAIRIVERWASDLTQGPGFAAVAGQTVDVKMTPCSGTGSSIAPLVAAYEAFTSENYTIGHQWAA